MQPFRKFTNSFGGVNGLFTANLGTAIADNRLIRGDNTTGIQGSGVTLTDADVMSGVTQLNVDNLRVDGNTLSSTNTNGDITLDPDGTGNAILASGNFSLTSGWINCPTAVKVKTANQSVSESTTFVNDSHLSMTLESGVTYGFRYFLFFNENGGGLKLDLDGTATHADIIFDWMHVAHGDVTAWTSGRGLVLGSVYDSGDTGVSECNLVINGTTSVTAGGTIFPKFACSDISGIGTQSLVALRGSRVEFWRT